MLFLADLLGGFVLLISVCFCVCVFLCVCFLCCNDQMHMLRQTKRKRRESHKRVKCRRLAFCQEAGERDTAVGHFAPLGQRGSYRSWLREKPEEPTDRVLMNPATRKQKSVVS